MQTPAAAAASLDVETTNWNAIKIIAVQHGISSHTLQQLRQSFAQPDAIDSSTDFGEGTPFHITTTRLDSGRHVYRFRTRQSHSNATTEPIAEQGMPRSSSSGAIYTHPHTPNYTITDPRAPLKAGLGASLSRMTGNISLKQSKSIPVLRRKPMSTPTPPPLPTTQPSTPIITNPKAPLGTRHLVSSLEEGDVLGAVLGLRHKHSTTRSDDVVGESTTQHQLPVFGTDLRFSHLPVGVDGATLGLLPQLDLGTTFAESPHLHQLREAASFDSNASAATQRASDHQNIDNYPKALPSHFQAAHDKDDMTLPDTFIYDVLQCYHHPATTGQSSQLAAPGDDPRFSIWAVQSEQQDGSLVASTRHGDVLINNAPSVAASPLSSSRHTSPQSSPIANMDEGVSQPKTTSDRTRTTSHNSTRSSLPAPRARMLAASPARLVAELTAEIDQPFLIDFFYTYRTFLDPLDLLTLLTLRFGWAISAASSVEDEARRRIVRVRTYVAIKYWLLHHFDHDFLPSRALRQRLASWLNQMAKDNRITSSSADRIIINSLRKIVRGLKQTYSRAGVGGLLLNDPSRITESVSLTPQRKKDSLSTVGSSSQDSVHSSNLFGSANDQTSAAASVEDLSLDFADEHRGQDSQPLPPNGGQTAVCGGGGEATTTRVAQKAAAESVILASRASASRASPMSPGGTPLGPASPPSPMPNPSSALSRAFVQTVGRLSRFKRILGSRGLGADGASEFDIDTGEHSDLLSIKGGVESLIEYFDMQSRRESSATKSTPHRPATLVEEEEGDTGEEPRSAMSGDSTGREETPSLVGQESIRSTPASSIDLGAHIEQPHFEHPKTNESVTRPLPIHHMTSEQTLRSVSPVPPSTAKAPETANRRISLMSNRSGARSIHQALRGSTSHDGPNIVQIDDIDLSSDEDDFAVRRALRRLPGARDLRHARTVKDLQPDPAVRASIDTQASSVYQTSYASKRGHGRSISADSASARLAPAFVLGTVQTEMLDPDEALQGYELVKGFKLDDIESDEEDESNGGVEAALRRLEGIIDEDRQKERANKVERLWQRSLARNAKAERQSTVSHTESQKRASSKADRPISSSHTGGSLADNEDASTSASADMSDRAVSRQQEEVVVEDGSAVLADLPSVASSGTIGAASPSRQRRASLTGTSPSAKMDLTRRVLPVHHSFLLRVRSETVARQMCLIESELLCAVTWDELSSTRWKERGYAAEVNDWEAFYRDRVRHRLEAQRLGKVYQERAVEAIVSRFNLTSNWVASEVVLTQGIEERAAVICKLIRIAWKCYLHSNFASLTQIIFGLSTPWVERLHRTWSRVGYYEMRIWKDLNSFVAPKNNFRHLRNAMLQLAPGQGCIPFFGLYLSDLMLNDSLLTFVDPVYVARTVGALPPLPPTVALEPLVNVVKFRTTAELIQQVASFQSAAGKYTFEAEKGVYVHCLKLRCLSGEIMARLSHLLEP